MSRPRTPLTYYGLNGELFWVHVEIRGRDECWPWEGAVNEKGYGIVAGPGRTTRKAHRIAWALTHGEPGRLCVLHKCDTPPCCNPYKCLFLGTRAINNADMRAKGREQRGEGHHSARLSEIDVLAIRERYAAGGVSQRALAREYGVGQQTLSALLARRTWTHL